MHVLIRGLVKKQGQLELALQDFGEPRTTLGRIHFDVARRLIVAPLLDFGP